MVDYKQAHQERWLHVKHEEQEAMLMSKLFPPSEAHVYYQKKNPKMGTPRKHNNF